LMNGIERKRLKRCRYSSPNLGCCVLRCALHEAKLAFLQTLDGYTLADLLSPGLPLVHSLGLAPEIRPEG
jgi:DNA-binding IscR family transcriptional regulator